MFLFIYADSDPVAKGPEINRILSAPNFLLSVEVLYKKRRKQRYQQQVGFMKRIGIGMYSGRH